MLLIFSPGTRAWLCNLAAATVCLTTIGLAPPVFAQSDAPVQTVRQFASSYDALIALAVQQINSGDIKAGLKTAREAFKAARTDFQKVEAARLVASAHYRSKQFIRAEYWLRRGLNKSPKGQQLSLLRQDFTKLRRENPLTVKLGFFAAPNSNINNGSSSETITIWNLPFLLSPDARALSGYEVSANIDLKYRVAQSDKFATDVGLTLFGRSYELSRASKKAAPNVRGGDYSFSLAEVSVNHNRKFGRLSGPSSFGLTVGKNWYGGDHYTLYARANLGQSFSLSPRTSANLSYGFERQISIQNNDLVSDIRNLGAGINHRLNNGDQVGFKMQWQNLRSLDITAENWSKRAELTYGFAKLLWGMQISLNTAAEKREFDVSVYDPSGRHDLNLSAGANLTFRNLSLFGFSPSVAIQSSRTLSNVSLFSRESTSVRFGIQSTF